MLWNAGCPDRDRETGRQTERQTERQLKSAKRAKEKRCCGRLAVLTEGQRDRQSDMQTSLDGKTDENTQIEKENDTRKKKTGIYAYTKKTEDKRKMFISMYSMFQLVWNII